MLAIVEKSFRDMDLVVPLRIAIEDGFDFTSPEFAALFAASEATGFQHPIWLDAFYRIMLAPNGAKPVILTGRVDGALVFVLPMVVRRQFGVRVLEAANLGVGDYAAPVVAGGWSAPAKLPAQIADVLPAHDLLNIRPIRAESISRWGCFFADIPATTLDFSAHSAILTAPFKDWRKTALSPSFTRYLDRKKRRFLNSGRVELRRLADESDIAEAIDAIASLRAGRFDNDLLQHDYARRFYAATAIAGERVAFARTYRLLLDGETTAIAFGLTLRGRFYYLLIGADYGRFAKHSPGLVLYDLLIEEWIADGGEVFDFTIGDESFKLDFGTIPTKMMALVQSRSLKGQAALALFQGLRRARRVSGHVRAKAALEQVEALVRRTIKRLLVTSGAVALFARPDLAERLALV